MPQESLLGSFALLLAAQAGLALAQAAPVSPPVLPAVKARSASTNVTSALTTAPRAAQVQITDDSAHAPYQEGGTASCANIGVCTIDFSVVPAGHRRLIEHLSCLVYVPAPGLPRYVALLATSFAAPRNFSPLSRSPADPAEWFVNNATLLHFEAGETPVAYASSDGAPIEQLDCTVTGRDIVLP